MCLLDHLMYDNLVYVQHHAHPSSPPLTPLPLWLMLFPTSPPSHQVLIYPCWAYAGSHSCCVPSNSHATPTTSRSPPPTLLGTLPGPGRQVYHAGLSTRAS